MSYQNVPFDAVLTRLKQKISFQMKLHTNKLIIKMCFSKNHILIEIVIQLHNSFNYYPLSGIVLKFLKKMFAFCCFYITKNTKRSNQPSGPEVPTIQIRNQTCYIYCLMRKEFNELFQELERADYHLHMNRKAYKLIV